MKSNKGFSLIELMVVVVIVGILASVAMPAYQDYVTRGKIPEATSALAQGRVLLEQYYQDNHRYANAVAGTTCGAVPANTHNFNFTCVATDAANNQTFTLSATGADGMTGFSYSIDQSNTKSSTLTASGWAATSTSCWITKKGGGC
jgi:type IV pilus assembly protein PilE